MRAHQEKEDQFDVDINETKLKEQTNKLLLFYVRLSIRFEPRIAVKNAYTTKMYSTVENYLHRHAGTQHFDLQSEFWQLKLWG